MEIWSHNSARCAVFDEKANDRALQPVVVGQFCEDGVAPQAGPTQGTNEPLTVLNERTSAALELLSFRARAPAPTPTRILQKIQKTHHNVHKIQHLPSHLDLLVNATRHQVAFSTDHHDARH